MKKSNVLAHHFQDEQLTATQALKIKGGDDKHPSLPFPLPIPPGPRPNCGTYTGNNNSQN